MPRSNKVAESSAAASGSPLGSDAAEAKELTNLLLAPTQMNARHFHSRRPLSTDDIDEQIRSFFAEGLV